jgi:hypothetical protein
MAGFALAKVAKGLRFWRIDKANFDVDRSVPLRVSADGSAYRFGVKE